MIDSSILNFIFNLSLNHTSRGKYPAAPQELVLRYKFYILCFIIIKKHCQRLVLIFLVIEYDNCQVFWNIFACSDWTRGDSCPGSWWEAVEVNKMFFIERRGLVGVPCRLPVNYVWFLTKFWSCQQVLTFFKGSNISFLIVFPWWHHWVFSV